MGDLKTSVIVDLKGNLEARTRRYNRAFFKMSVHATRRLGVMNRAIIKHGKVLSRLSNRYTAFIGLGSGAAAAKSVLSLEERMARLGVQANIDDGAVEALKKKVFATAKQKDVRIKADELFGAIEKIVEKTGDLDLATENIRNIALAIQATGAAGGDIGAMIADMQEKFGLRQAKEFLNTLDTLVKQGKSGSFTLQNLATQGERVTAAYAATGRVGPVAVREMGAILQMVKRGVGSAEEASTAYERLLSTLTQEKSAALEKAGITIWDPEQLAKGNKVARAVPEIIKDIIRKTKGDTEKLAKVFDVRALRALIPFGIEYQRTGGFESFDKFLNISGDGSQLRTDSQRIADVGNSSINNLGSTVENKLDKYLSAPLKKAADSVNELLDGKKRKSVQYFPTDSETDFIKKFREERLSKIQGVIKLEVSSQVPVKVRGIQSKGVDLEVDTGKQMVNP